MRKPSRVFCVLILSRPLDETGAGGRPRGQLRPQGLRPVRNGNPRDGPRRQPGSVDRPGRQQRGRMDRQREGLVNARH